jgi:hypothetical protein
MESIVPDEKYVIRRYKSSRNAGAYSGLSGFIKNNPKYKDVNTVRKVLSGVDAYSLHKDARRNFKRPAVMCSAINYMWSTDLIFYQNYARENKGNKYILIAVDCLSKFMYAEAMKKKTSDDTIEVFKKIFKRSKSTPTKLWVDMGT